MKHDMPKRPQFSRDFYRPSHAWAALHLTFAALLYFFPGYTNYTVAVSGLPIVLKALMIVPLTVLAVYGINMMGFVGHEGMHGSLVRSRMGSALIGLFYASAVVTYFEFGFSASHWNHHRFTNQKDDPDVEPVSGLKPWWQRVILSRPIYNWLYFLQTLRPALGLSNNFKYNMPFKAETQKWLARLNFIFAAVWLAFYVTVFILNPWLGLFGILALMITVNFIGACQTYIDHAGLDDRLFQNGYSRVSPINTVLYFGANYHLEHHAYPGIPSYRLPKVHRILVEKGIYRENSTHIVGGFFEGFRALPRPYNVHAKERDFDAFTLAIASETPAKQEEQTDAL